MSLQPVPALGRRLGRSPFPALAVLAHDRDVKGAARRLLHDRIDGEHGFLALELGRADHAADGDASLLLTLERAAGIDMPAANVADLELARGACDLVLYRLVHAALRV